MLKDDTQGLSFQKSKFIGGDNGKGKFIPYFIKDPKNENRILLYNILQIYDIQDDGSYKQLWINNTFNKELYFSVCCGDAVIALNINDMNLSLIENVMNPIDSKMTELIQIDLDKMIGLGNVINETEKRVEIQAKYFQPVKII
jgi:hypothetical protein